METFFNLAESFVHCAWLLNSSAALINVTSVSDESMHDVLMIESSCTSLMQVHLYYSDPTYILIKYTLWKD